MVLAGAGHAHLQVLRAWAADPARLLSPLSPEGDTGPKRSLKITLVSPWPQLTYSGMVPGHVAGRYTLEQAQIDIAQVVAPLERLGLLRWERQFATGLDASAQRLVLASGETLAYDWLSLDVGGAPDRAALPGSAERALFVRPIEQFATLWPRLLALCEERMTHVAMVGGGAGGVELALAMRQRLSRSGGVAASAPLTLLAGDAEAGGLLGGHPVAVRQGAMRLLRERGITVINDRAVGVEPEGLRLAGGSLLLCDAPVVATPVVGPAWLQGSGLALDERGFVSTGATLQSSSHASVLAVGDVASRVDVRRPRSGVFAVRAGPPLERNLVRALAGQPLLPWVPQQRSLNLLDAGDGGALLSWGSFGSGGWLARPLWGWVKRRIDEGFVAGYR